MGRESRRPRRKDLDRGDAGRMVAAHGKCVVLLSTDLRVQQFYEHWLAERARLAAAGPPPGITSTAELEQVIAREHAEQIDALAGVLRAMGVPWRWAAEALIGTVFPIAVHNARHPHGPRQVLQVSADGLGTLPAGRKPRHGGQDVWQWVTWWYQHKVKVPPVSIYKLAQEYAAREYRHSRADSVVEDGIVRAEQLLNRVIRPAGLGQSL
jgi:hypothetical protein